MNSDRLLVTPSELSAWQRGRLSVLDVGSATYSEDVAERALGAAQEALMRYLQFDPFVHPVSATPWWQTQYTAVGATDGVYAWVDGPIVAVTTAGVTFSGRRLFATTTPSGVVAFYVGWRGARHVLTGATGSQVNLTGLAGLTALGVVPAELPDDLHVAICQAALVVAESSQHDGLETVEVDIGTQVRRSERMRPHALREVFSKYAGTYRIVTP